MPSLRTPGLRYPVSTLPVKTERGMFYFREQVRKKEMKEVENEEDWTEKKIRRNSVAWSWLISMRNIKKERKENEKRIATLTVSDTGK